MENKVLEILQRVRSDIDYSKEKSMMTDGVLDSFDVVGIITELADEFDIEITIDDMTEENFDSLEAICAMVARIQDED